MHTKTRKPANCTSVTTWVPDALLAQLDAHLAAQCAPLVGARPSRQAWILAAVRRVLSDAASPALALHRARLAEAAASENP